VATAAPVVPASEALPPIHASLTWWLAAGLVGADIGTSVFYSSGVLWPYVGFAAPVFILAVCLCMWLFKTTYQEGCAVSPLNGGAYTMVLQTIGRRAALIVGSLTILSYLATAVVSALSGSLYLSSLWTTWQWPLWLIVLVAMVPVFLFAGLNLIGLKESTRVVFAIAFFHFGMLIVMDVWGLWLAFSHPVPWDRILHGFSGLVDGKTVSYPGFMQLSLKSCAIGFAYAFLGITGFESAAQIIEEIEAPNWKSVQKVYLVIVVLVTFTSPLSAVLAMVLLEPGVIVSQKDSLLSALAFYEGGHVFRTVLVFNACFTLFAAVNTAFAGATGLMTTMGKQGNLPGIVLRRWMDKAEILKGFPYVSLPFGVLCLVMLLAFPGAVDKLGSIYGMAFLGVMTSYCIGVVLLRLHQPRKVSRAPWISKWTVGWKGTMLPIAPMIGAIFLGFAEITQLLSEAEARSLGMQMFLVVLLVMVYYRLGQIETRMVRLPDLRLGLGKYRKMDEMPALPAYVICTMGNTPSSLVTQISHVMKTYGENIEIVVFHAEDQTEQHGVVSEGLERMISQQLLDFYENRDLILSVKVLPGNLIEVLPEWAKKRKLQHVFIATGHNKAVSEDLRNHLANELGIEVIRLDEHDLPKGPGVWFSQWQQGLRESKWDPSGGGSGDRADHEARDRDR
jgi:amino acid transporter